MIRTLLVLASTLLAAAACASNPASAPKTATSPDKETVSDSSEAEEDEAASSGDADESNAPEAAARELGDYFVYRFDGSFTDQPMMLTEQVVAIEDGLLVVDYVLERGDQMEAMRVRMRDDGHYDVVSAAGLQGDEEVPATLKEYEAFIAVTQFIPDSNDETVGTNETTCLVATEELSCLISTYVVTIGEKQALLTISSSDELVGRDVGGEVVGPDGNLVYSARLIDRGNEKPEVDGVAKSDRTTLRFTPTAP